ncbi:MAG: pyridoxal phosphate-dependent aminotransferase [Acidobacteria bacterium]|nr:pyridoxal phosphate-dependent aminotransferase [Acidobacteriota bacterium]
MRFAERMSRLGTETAFEVLVRARNLEAQGREIIHLEIGEPDFQTPRNVIEAAQEALDKGWTHYGPPQGYLDLREVIAAHVAESRGIAVRPEQVVVVPGGKPIMFFAMLALLDPGDEVIYPNPGFPIYESMIRFLGAVPQPLRLSEERGFALDLNGLADLLNERTRLVILNSPQNPTGGVLPQDDLAEIARLCARRDLLVLSDEIYSRIIYEGRHRSIASFPGMPEKTIILDGFSKTYAMTGWRLGYGVMPTELAKAVERLQVNATSCTASFTQRAGLAALTGPQDPVCCMVEEFRKRRDLMVAGLNQIPGFRCTLPGGAFYAFPNITGTGRSSRELAELLLESAGVACLSGTAFGQFGEGYLRFSYANSEENIRKALERIDSAVRETAGCRP